MSKLPGTETETTEVPRCIRCKRVLKTKRAIADGYGWRCRIKLLEAAREVSKIFTREQVRKAATALRQGTIKWHAPADVVPAHGKGYGIYQCQSSNKRDVYTTTAYTCDCPSRVRCYHQCAVMIRELTPLHRH